MANGLCRKSPQIKVLIKNKFDFRKTKWGQSKSDVLSTESADRIEGLQDDILGYNTTVGGLKAMAGYYFVNDKLWKGVYIFGNSQQKSTLKLPFHNENSKKKYGDPTETDVLWSNDLYKNDFLIGAFL